MDNLKIFLMNVKNWETLAADWNAWKNSIKKGIVMFEERKIQRAELKCVLQKGAIVNCFEDPNSWKCNVLDYTFLSKIRYL